MKKQALFCMVLAGTLIVGGCGQKAADSTAATAQVTETSDSAPADKPDGAPGENSDKPGNPPDGAQGSLDGKQAPPDGGNGGPGDPARADRTQLRHPIRQSQATPPIPRRMGRPTPPQELMRAQFSSPTARTSP
ncbi:MAG: hypothetical protein V8S93_09305 [Lachnospiraceae bacterium]